MKVVFSIIVFVFLAALGITFFLTADHPVTARERNIEGYTDIARQMNIRNLVSVVYLGPRIIDTMVEVLVVVLTVFGMMHIRGKRP